MLSGRCSVSESTGAGAPGGAEALLGYRFSDVSLLEEALTHGSTVRGGEGERQTDYDRLEFLGDAVLELLTRDYLMKLHPDESEGELTRRKAGLVSAENLASAGVRMGLDRMVRLGSEFDSRGCPASVVADVVEAVIGAIYRDGGLEEAGRIVMEHILLYADSAEDGSAGDPKSRLQELLQADGKPVPHYRTAFEEGTEHEPLFRCTVWSLGSELGRGSGRSKRKAQQAAAEDALSRLEG